MGRQDVVGGHRILRRAGGPIESINPERIPGYLHWGEDSVGRSHQRSAVMRERAGVIKIDRRRPANPIETWHGWLVDRRVLGVAGKGRNAPGRNGNTRRAAPVSA